MILLTNLDSIIESLYLNIPLTNKFRDSKIIVNPENITYLVGKTIVINRFSYSNEDINILIKNNNKIVSRLFSNDSRINFIPYFPRMCSKIFWNGEYVKFLNEDIYENVDYVFDGESLFYPKCKEYLNILGEHSDCNALGYLLYQLGENIYQETPFIDLDIVKIGKGIFP